ncbi:GNAT family N-acetyltransferase [Polaribacter sp. Hel1_85]|uniref:GNAT family N-acetyltransferase n=1 Tax=Polaribacter sp. Hel1_85 TaxID=1250005 RepID=UPI00052E2011|nr:GNAT family N-acetyltransferase [Polaribacter sp. Hel1_85]KGL62434.1 acetyltransferase (GNAT) family protein [Polaribacter sp. Hel1_85]
MIDITEELVLKEINTEDYNQLYNLMNEIYPLAYSHFWIDNGAWYVNSQYSKENILRELSEEKADYYFVVFNDEIIGNFRIIWDEKLPGLNQENQVKLHRVYLHQKTQGNGIGKKLLSWLEEKAIKKGYKVIWLDAMDEQPQAFQFYKKLGYKYYSHTFLPYNLLHKEVRKMSQIYKRLT